MEVLIDTSFSILRILLLLGGIIQCSLQEIKNSPVGPSEQSVLSLIHTSLLQDWCFHWWEGTLFLFSPLLSDSQEVCLWSGLLWWALMLFWCRWRNSSLHLMLMTSLTCFHSVLLFDRDQIFVLDTERCLLPELLGKIAKEIICDYGEKKQLHKPSLGGGIFAIWLAMPKAAFSAINQLKSTGINRFQQLSLKLERLKIWVC